MLNSIVSIDYLNDYHELVYRLYSAEFPGYPTVYYRLDITNSTIETTGFRSGSFELVGELSGYRWNKIYKLPIFNAESISDLNSNYDERGITIDISTSFILPYEFGLVPLNNDFILFPNNVLRKGFESKYPLFVITNVATASISSKSFYKITCKVHFINQDQIDHQVTNEFVFIDFLKKIYPIDVARELLRTMKTLDNDMRKLYEEYINKNNGLLDIVI